VSIPSPPFCFLSLLPNCNMLLVCMIYLQGSEQIMAMERMVHCLQHDHRGWHGLPVVLQCTSGNAQRCVCRSYSKSFATIGLLYAGIECVIEKHRGKHDWYNSLYTGFATGGLLARGSAQPAGMALHACVREASAVY
jgi:Tim17/Tim22/Tim23/Pmp24 family